MQTPQGIMPYVLQFLALAAGIALIATSARWNDRTLVIASGIFFINIFWVTMVLGHDFRIWSFLRNTGAGNVFLIGLILANLLYIAVKAIINLVK